jgi:hypothetical protein
MLVEGIAAIASMSGRLADSEPNVGLPWIHAAAWIRVRRSGASASKPSAITSPSLAIRYEHDAAPDSSCGQFGRRFSSLRTSPTLPSPRRTRSTRKSRKVEPPPPTTVPTTISRADRPNSVKAGHGGT